MIDGNNLRRELFKFYYATQIEEKFGLFKKADASEFLQAALDLAHFCLSKKNKTYVYDNLRL